MNKHLKGCPYILNEATKSELNDFFQNVGEKDIQNRLAICLNKMLKQVAEIDNKNNKVGKEKK